MMDRLPVEILELICSFVDRDALMNTSLVDKRARHAALPGLFKSVTIAYSSAETLSATIERWTEILASTSSFRHVRHLCFQDTRMQSSASQIGRQPVRGSDFSLGAWRNTPGRPSGQLLDDGLTEWQQLARLLRNTIGLQDLTWIGSTRIPSCILDEVDSSGIHIKLHVARLQLQLLDTIASVQSAKDIVARDLRLATSLFLTSISVTCAYKCLYDELLIDYANHAVSRMVAGAAPNLKCLHLFWIRVRVRMERMISRSDADTHKRDTLNKLLPYQSKGGKGALQTLELSCDTDPLTYWNALTDFTLLRSLTVRHGLTQFALDGLVTQGMGFPSLQKLDIRLKATESTVLQELAKATDRFILSLPPLKNIRLSGNYNRSTVMLALRYSGASLEELYLPLPEDTAEWLMPERSAFVDIELLHCLQSTCPNLRKVELCLLRTQGDCEEAALYRELGRHKALRDIRLALYSTADGLWGQSSDDTSDSQRHDDWMLDVDQAHPELDAPDKVRTAFVDLAVDEILVKAIFTRISAAKPPYAHNLERLVVQPEQPEIYGSYESGDFVTSILTYVARAFAYVPSRGECLEYHRHGEDPDEARRDYLQEERFPYHRQLLEEVVSLVWPDINIGRWYEEWHSFPLAELTE